MALSKKHTFQILTKRPERMLEYYTLHFSRSKCSREASTFSARRDSERGGDLAVSDGQFPLPNLWIGVSVENQQTANERISLLLRMPAAVRWISAEPLLGPIDLSEWIKPDCEKWELGYKLHWVVAGGESGPYARPMHPNWVFSLLEQCNAANIHFFFKQWGEWVSPGLNGFGTHPGKIAWIDSTGAFLGGNLYDAFPIRSK
jgi:protein gp37